MKLKLICDCCGGEETCGSLTIINMGEKDIEINGIYLNPKTTKKLIKFLNLTK